jgi:hypothetical protein
LRREKHDDEQQEEFQQKRTQHSPVGENSSLSLTRQSRARTGKRRTDRGDEVIPSRRPFHQQFRRIIYFDDRYGFDLESFNQV